MANNLKELVEMIKFSTGEKVEDIAKQAELSRSHLTVLFNEEEQPSVYDKLYTAYHQKITKKINESIRIYMPAASELSFAREPASPYGENTRVRLSLKALKNAVAQLEEDLALKEIAKSDINKAAKSAEKVSRKRKKSVGGK